ncbi:hypothetical protein LINPERPRIM_LOCUS18020 [Linum perenne]
MRSVTRRPGTR